MTLRSMNRDKVRRISLNGKEINTNVEQPALDIQWCSLLSFTEFCMFPVSPKSHRLVTKRFLEPIELSKLTLVPPLPEAPRDEIMPLPQLLKEHLELVREIFTDEHNCQNCFFVFFFPFFL